MFLFLCFCDTIKVVILMEDRIKYIDATNTEIIEDSLNSTNKEYSINDCVIVRTTDVFPFDGIVQSPINGNAYGFGSSLYFGEIVSEMLRNKYLNRFTNEEEEKNFFKELHEYEVVFETLRRTVHFTINGLVGSTAYGNFDNKPFVIIDPLKYHLDNSIRGMRVEDTYFEGDLSLSNESAIVIDEGTYNKISEDPKYSNDLAKFKIYVYKGNQQNAVSLALNDMGYDSFMVSSNGYVNGIDGHSRASKMYDFVNEYIKNNNISNERHFYSQINYEDALARNEKAEEINMMHLMYVLDNSNIPKEVIDNIKLLIEERREITGLLEVVIFRIGFEQLKKLTKEFNDNYINKLKQGKNSKLV